MKNQMIRYRRHADGPISAIKDLINSIKEWNAKFIQLDAPKKLIVITSKISQIAASALAAKNAIELRKHLKGLKYWGNAIKKVQEKDPNFIPSSQNLYFNHKAKAIYRGISIITNLIGFVLSRYAEKNIMNKGEDNMQIKTLTTHDSMPWAMRVSKFNDKVNQKEAKKKIEKNIKVAEQNLQKLKKVKDPEVQIKVRETEKKLSKFKAWFKQSAIAGAKVVGSIAIYYTELFLMFGLIAGIARLVRLPAERRARRRAEEAATRRFQQWRQQHGVTTPPRVPPTNPTPNVPPAATPIPRDTVSAVSNLERAAEGIQEGIRELDLDEVINNGPSASPGEHGARFSGIEYDSKFGNRRNRITTHDLMPWARNDAGVKGMKKGQHVMARDPEYKASLQGGGAAPSSSPAKPSAPAAKQGNNKHGKAKAIAKMVGAAAAIAGAGVLGAKAMRHMQNRWASQNNRQQPRTSNNSGPRITQQTSKVRIGPSSSPSPSQSFKPLKPESLHEFQKKVQDPNYEFDI